MATSDSRKIKDSKVLVVSERGQVTIPKKFRSKFKTNFLVCYPDSDGRLILAPMETKEEFFDELESSYRDWKKRGGYSFDEVMGESEKMP